MDESYLRLRLAQLRTEKGISARHMSIMMGQNPSYISQIENGLHLPSWSTFFYICEFLGISPSEFFDEGMKYPQQFNQLIDTILELEKEDIEALQVMANTLTKKQNKKK